MLHRFQLKLVYFLIGLIALDLSGNITVGKVYTYISYYIHFFKNIILMYSYIWFHIS